jgi:hypothetical protein
VLLLLNQNLYKWRTQNECGVSTFTMRGVFIVVNGVSTDLERSVWCQVVAGQPSHLAGRPGGAASTDSGLSSSSRMATKAWAEPLQTQAGRPRCSAGRSTPGPTRPMVWPTWSMCQIHPGGDDDFDIWSTPLCHPLNAPI